MASNKNVVPTSYRIVSFEMIYLIVAYRTLVKCLVGEEDRNGKYKIMISWQSNALPSTVLPQNNALPPTRRLQNNALPSTD